MTMVSRALPGFFFAATGCADVLGYDDIKFEQDAGDVAFADGASGTGGVVSGGGAGGLTTGGTAGAPPAGGSGGWNQGGSGGVPSGGGSSGAPSGGGGTTNGGGAPWGGGGTSGGGAPSGGVGGSTSGGGAPSGGGGSSGGAGGGGSGGAPSGGTGNGGSGGTSSGGATGHYETKTTTGATGAEPGGIVPVCCVPSPAEKASIDKAFSLLNAHRAANGVPAVAYDEGLQAPIEAHVHHMAIHSFFAHQSPEVSVSSPAIRSSLCGAKGAAEILMAGNADPEAALNAWKNSSIHNSIMLSSAQKRVGIGLYGYYWGMVFGQ